MRLTRYRIGDYFETLSKKCNIPNLTEWDVSGINIDKEFFTPSKQVGEDTSKYKVVPPNYFACNLMHVGRDVVLPIALNYTTNDKIVSPAYTVFKIVDNSPILRDYFFLMLKSHERDRFFWFNTDSSIRGDMPWETFCNIELEVPPIPVQQKYVEVYKAINANKNYYEYGLDDLKLVCDAYIENLRRKIECEKIGTYINEVNERNIDLRIKLVQGVNSSSSFDETKANMSGIDTSNYKIVRTNQFAYNPSRINLGSIALLRGSDCIISPMYTVFEISNQKKLLPEYLMMWFSRKEFQRSTLFYATGSVRDIFDFNAMKEVKIPIPDLETQKSIIEIYNTYNARKAINKRLEDLMKRICPILISGSLKECAE